MTKHEIEGYNGYNHHRFFSTQRRVGDLINMSVGRCCGQVGRCDQERKLEVVVKLEVVISDKLGVMVKTES